MSARSNGTKMNKMMCIAGVLLCLTLIMTHMTSGLYSRYVSSASGSDSARVITFGDIELKETGDFVKDPLSGENDFLIVPGADLTKRVQVGFKGSEAATYVFVKAELSGNWKGSGVAGTIDTFKILSADESTAYLKWQIENGWKYLSKSGNEYVYYKEVDPNTKLTDVDIVADEGLITVSSKILSGTSFDGTYIKFQAKVVQAGGFADAAAAWNSVSSK